MLFGWLLLGARWAALLAVRLVLVVQDDLLGCFALLAAVTLGCLILAARLELRSAACKLDVGSESEQQSEPGSESASGSECGSERGSES